jgi:hypothetical protein
MMGGSTKKNVYFTSLLMAIYPNLAGQNGENDDK